MKDFIKWAIENVPNLNLGGCLWIVFAAFKYAEKHHPEDLSSFLIYQHDFNYKGNNLSENLQIIASGDEFSEKNCPKASLHFSFSFQGENFNHEPLNSFCIIEPLPLETSQIPLFCETALKYGCWNTAFDREQAQKLLTAKFQISVI